MTIIYGAQLGEPRDADEEPQGQARVLRFVPAGGLPRTRAPDYTPRRVLIVDDDPYARTALEEFFSAYGYETSLAKDGQEALALLSGVPVDFVILDLLMPGLSGFDFLKAKKGMPAPMREVPVAVVSAVRGPFLGEVAAVFLKPVPILELLEVVGTVLARRNAARSNAG